MFCPTCGAQSADTSHFCVTCGNVLPSPPQPTDASPQISSTPRFDLDPSRPASSSPETTHLDSGLPRYPSTPTGGYLPPPPNSFPGGPSYYGEQPQWSPGNAIPGTPLAPFGAPLAGWWQRVGSLFLDILILDIPYLILAVIVSVATRTTTNGVRQTNGTASRILFVVFLIVQASYFSYLNGVGRGQTLGNRAMNIAVRDINTGEPIGAGRGFLRWFVRILLYVLFLPGIINDLLPLWSARRQTIADKAANSVMIRV